MRRRGGFSPWTRAVTVQVKGGELEQFLNACLRKGIDLFSVDRPADHMLIVRLGARDFPRLRTIGGRRAWQMRIVQRHGGGFILTRLVRRPSFVLGGLLALIAWYVLSSYIWFVDVQGLERLPKAAVLEVARAAGVVRGVPVSSLDADHVQRQLLLSLDDLVWAALEVRGTQAVIHVAERRVPDMAAQGPGHIVAAVDGVIERISVLSGAAVVEPGETVRKGQLLISGQLPPGSEEFDAKIARGELPYVRAVGSVTAVVWHETSAEAVIDVGGVDQAAATARDVALALAREWLTENRAEAVGDPVVTVEEIEALGVVKVTLLVQAVREIGAFQPVTW